MKRKLSIFSLGCTFLPTKTGEIDLRKIQLNDKGKRLLKTYLPILLHKR